MNPYKAQKMAKWIAIVIVIAMLVTSFSFIMFLPSMLGREGSVVYAATKSTQSLNAQTDELGELIKYIQENYKDVVTQEQLVDGAAQGIIDSLGDPYSVYYKTTEESQDFEESVAGVFSGVGIVLQTFDGKCVVVTPIAGTPAQKAGVKSGDVITKVDNASTEGMTTNEVALILRGKEGTKVNITVKRNDQLLSFSLTREIIKTTSVNYEVLENNIGYIQITSFDIDTHTEFASAKSELVKKGVKSLIVDVRDNPGGYINTAAEIADQLMPAGPITYLEQQGKSIETISATGKTHSFLPTVLLVNEGSASASEILAGALKDSNSATLVGTTTFGKGVAQQVIDITENTAMKLSMYYFLTPNKTTINHVGITPQYTVQSSANANAEELSKSYIAFAPMSEKVKAKKGDIGLNVFGAQQRLALIGYNVKINGTLDDQTAAAVQKFQSEKGLNPYGVLDYTTMAKIDGATVEYITGTAKDADLQLQKAIELINQGKVTKVK